MGSKSDIDLLSDRIKLNIPKIQELLEQVGAALQQRLSKQEGLPPSKNEAGDVLSQHDLDAQTTLYEGLHEMHPNFRFVGEEDIEGDCSTEFDDDIGQDVLTWVMDPIDGSNNYWRGKDDFAINAGLMRGRTPIFGMVHFPVSKITVIGGVNIQTTINGKPVPPSLAYDAANIHMAIGLGKKKSQSERDAFIHEIETMDEAWDRPGCASASILLVLTGKATAYASLKERFTNLVPWFAILEGTEVETNAGLYELDMNKDFCLVVAKPGFVAAKMKAGSRLAKCLDNENSK